MSGPVLQLQATLWCVTISWPACLLASAQGAFSHSLSPCHSSQVNRPQAIRGNYCTCSCSLDSMNEEKMISSAKVYCHFNFLAGSLIFVAFKMKVNYPVLSHFQFSGRERSGTWKSLGRVGYRDSVGPWPQVRRHKFQSILVWGFFFEPVCLFLLSLCYHVALAVGTPWKDHHSAAYCAIHNPQCLQCLHNVYCSSHRRKCYATASRSPGDTRYYCVWD